MAMRTRNWQIGAAVIVGLAALQSPLMLPAGLVLLGRWVYLDTKARRICNPIAWAIIVPISWIFMLPVYLARRPLVAGEVRTGGTWWNLLRAFAATYAVGTALLGLRYLRPALFGLVWTIAAGNSAVMASSQFVGVLLLIALPAVLALGVGMLVRKPTTEVGPAASLTARTPGPCA
jgi:hypothetical protein